ncbi:FAD-dependent monooxygenase [Photorhabdus tasmaniensis]|uniref:FAD-dependent monooxygenase n=1 Tax=Photorhabdus sp. RM323S TaxID=3342828 RepID=UPI0036D9E024
MIETDVLIVGSGPSGSAAALFLSTYGINTLVITKHRWLANTPRAHITNQRTIEILSEQDKHGVEHGKILAEAMIKILLR